MNETLCTRVRKAHWKKTVSITLPQILIERVRNYGLNISRVTENALLSILDFLETQNVEGSSEFLSTGSFQKESVVDGTGFEPAASTMPTWRSFQADLPAHDSVSLKKLFLSLFILICGFYWLSQ